jgi:hypothetical protein
MKNIFIIAVLLGIFAIGCSDEFLFIGSGTANISEILNITNNGTGFICANITTANSTFYLCNVTAGYNITNNITINETYNITNNITIQLNCSDDPNCVMTDGTRNITPNLYVTNNISLETLLFGERTGIYTLLRVNPFGSDGFSMQYWYDFELANDDWLVFQKTDGNDDHADGGIAFMMSNATNNTTILKLDGYGMANFTDYNIETTGNITAGNVHAGNICYSNGTNCQATTPTMNNITGSGVPFIINATGSNRCIRFEATSVFIGSGSNCYG